MGGRVSSRAATAGDSRPPGYAFVESALLGVYNQPRAANPAKKASPPSASPKKASKPSKPSPPTAPPPTAPSTPTGTSNSTNSAASSSTAPKPTPSGTPPSPFPPSPTASASAISAATKPPSQFRSEFQDHDGKRPFRKRLRYDSHPRQVVDSRRRGRTEEGFWRIDI